MRRKDPSQNPDQNPDGNPDGNPAGADKGPTSKVRPGDDLAPGEIRPALIFAEMQRNDLVEVWRENDSTKDREYHGRLNYEEASIPYVAQRFGGGFYRFQLIRNKQYARSLGQEIPGPYKPPTGPLPGTAAVYVEPGEPSDARAATAGMSPRELLDYAAFSRMMEVMKQPVAAPAASSGVLRDLAPIIAPLVAALGTILVERMTKAPTADPLLVQQLQEVREGLKKLQDAPGPAVAGLNDVFDAVDKFSKIRERLAGGSSAAEGSGDGDMWKGILRTGMEFLAQGRAGPPPGQPAPGFPSAPPQLSAGAPPAAGDVPMPPWHQMLQEYRPMLVQAAQTGKNPGVAAAIVAEWCPDNYRGTLNELAQATNTETLLTQAVPELQHFPAWVNEFVEEVRAALFGEEDEPDDPKPETPAT